MSSQNKKIVLRVLEETGFAYMISCGSGAINADYAEYASRQALTSFRQALKDPNLTYEHLCKILRRASQKESAKSCKTPWSIFMANYLEQHCNTNVQRTH